MANHRAVTIAAISSLLIPTCSGFGLPSPNLPITIKTAPPIVGVASVAPTRRSLHPGNNRLAYHPSTSVQRPSTLLAASPSASYDNSKDRDDDGSDDDGIHRSPSSSSTGDDRPDWALPWMPTWLITLRPRTQLLVGLILYVFHLRILTQHQWTFPFQLIPNDEGWFQSVGLDSLAGMLSFAGLIWLRKASVKAASQGSGVAVAVPPIWSDPTEAESPWRLRSKKKPKSNESADGEVEETKEQHPRSSSIVAFVLLTVGYFSTGRFSLLFENLLYAAAGFGLPLTVPMHRSLVVLLGHLAWVVVGSAVLAGALSPKPFFGGGWDTKKSEKKDILRPFRWYTNKWDTYWLWWTIGGYFVSAWLFNVADYVNQLVLPPHLFAMQAEGVVSQLINPENNDFLASLVGYIAPCLSAPWWEEVLYRGYLLPALGLFMGFWPSVFVSGVLFSVHHLSLMGAIPLMVLGWLWAALYAKSGNILVTILIHGMWNSRVFLGSWLGL